MADIEINQHDVQRLGEKLGGLTQDLEEHEQLVLAAVFGLAADALATDADAAKPGRSGVRPVPGRSVREQFVSAFAPGLAEQQGESYNMMVSIGPGEPGPGEFEQPCSIGPGEPPGGPDRACSIGPGVPDPPASLRGPGSVGPGRGKRPRRGA